MAKVEEGIACEESFEKPLHVLILESEKGQLAFEYLGVAPLDWSAFQQHLLSTTHRFETQKLLMVLRKAEKLALSRGVSDPMGLSRIFEEAAKSEKLWKDLQARSTSTKDTRKIRSDQRKQERDTKLWQTRPQTQKITKLQRILLPLLKKYRKEPVQEEESRVIARYARDSNRMEKTSEGQVVWLYIENSVKKTLNDKVFLDHDLVDAVDEAFYGIFMEEFKKNTLLTENVVQLQFTPKNSVETEILRKTLVKINEYKFLQMAFKKVDGLEEELQKVFKQTKKRYQEEINALGPELAEVLEERGRGLSRNPVLWHQGSWAQNTARAEFVTKFARGAEPDADGYPRLHSDVEYEKSMIEVLKKKKTLRTEILENLKEKGVLNSGLFHPISAGSYHSDYNISLRLLIELRRMADRADDLESYILLLQEALWYQFGVMIEAETIIHLRDYFNILKLFSVTVTTGTRVLVDLDQARFGVSSNDVVGMGALNLYYLDALLTGTQTEDLDKVVQLSMEANDFGTADLKNRILGVKEAIWAIECPRCYLDELIYAKRLGLSWTEWFQSHGTRYPREWDSVENQIFASGDDVDWIPAREIAPEERSMVSKILVENGTASHLRQSWIESLFDERGPQLTGATLSAYKTASQNLLKAQLDALSKEFPYSRLKELSLRIEIIPSLHQIGQVDLFISGQPREDEVEKIREIFKDVLSEIRQYRPLELRRIELE